MLTLSASAVEAVDSLLHSNPDVPDEAGLRILPISESELTIELAVEPEPEDQVIERGGARVFVDGEIAPMLDNAELIAREDGGQLAFGLSVPGGPSSSTANNDGSSPH
jgi:Fe-S cluster assembly iron-binding protein IscA